MCDRDRERQFESRWERQCDKLKSLMRERGKFKVGVREREGGKNWKLVWKRESQIEVGERERQIWRGSEREKEKLKAGMRERDKEREIESQCEWEREIESRVWKTDKLILGERERESQIQSGYDREREWQTESSCERETNFKVCDREREIIWKCVWEKERETNWKQQWETERGRDTNL